MMANLGTFPVSYMGNVVNGSGMGGLLPSVVNVIILAMNADFQLAGTYLCVYLLSLMVWLEIER